MKNNKKHFIDLDGIFIELGSYSSKESINLATFKAKSKNKNITVYCIDEFRTKISEQRSNNNLDIYVNGLRRSNVLDYINVLQLNTLEASRIFGKGSVSYLYLNFDPFKSMENLEVWFDKVVIGGIIKGPMTNSKNEKLDLLELEKFLESKHQKLEREGVNWVVYKEKKPKKEGMNSAGLPDIEFR